MILNFSFNQKKKCIFFSEKKTKQTHRTRGQFFDKCVCETTREKENKPTNTRAHNQNISERKQEESEFFIKIENKNDDDGLV